MSYGLEIYNEDGFLLINEDSYNHIVMDITNYTVDSIRYLRHLDNNDPVQLQYPTQTSPYGGYAPAAFISIPVGGIIWDATINNQNAGGGALAQHTSVGVITSRASSYRMMRTFCVNNLADVAFTQEDYGLEIYDGSSNIVWANSMQSVSVDATTEFSVSAAFSAVNPRQTTYDLHLVASREPEADEDFFITIQGIGAVSDYEGEGIAVERVISTEYVVRYAMFNDTAHNALYPEWASVYDKTWVVGNVFAYSNVGTQQFAAGIMKI